MTTALILIDFQQGFDNPKWGRRNNPQAEERALHLLAHARSVGWKIIIVRHDSTELTSPLHPSHTGNALKPGFEPQEGEWLLGKCVHSAFIGTSLAERLRDSGLERIIIAGITTDQCVSTSTRMAHNLGFEVILASDACACFGLTGPDGKMISAETLHAAHLATLNAEFARVTSVADLTGESIETPFALRQLLPEPSNLVKRKALPQLDTHMRAFIALSPMVFVGSHARDGQTDVSPRGDPPGFVAVLDANTLMIPERPGNRRADTLQNVLDTGEVGLLFMVPGVMDTLRVNGSARLVTDLSRLMPLAVEGKTPQFAIEVTIREAYLHCARCTHRAHFWDTNRWAKQGTLPHLAEMLASQMSDIDPNALRDTLKEMYKNELY